MPDPYPYTYTQEQLDLAIEWGTKREAHQAATAMRNPWGRGGNDTSGAWTDWNHIVGTLGEIIVGAVTQVPWIPGVGLSPDLPNGMLVRTRRVPGSGIDLCLHAHDKPYIDRRWALVHLFINQPFRAAVMGWIEGRKAMTWQYARETQRYGGRVCFVPPDDLHDIRGVIPKQIAEYVNNHLCHCGKYGTLNNEHGNGPWFCVEHIQ